jgi:hypothetical protein
LFVCDVHRRLLDRRREQNDHRLTASRGACGSLIRGVAALASAIAKGITFGSVACLVIQVEDRLAKFRCCMVGLRRGWREIDALGMLSIRSSDARNLAFVATVFSSSRVYLK